MSPHVPPTRALTTLLAGLLSLVVLVLSAGPADAHTALVSSDPAASETRATAPQLITLRFSESMNPDLSTIALTIDGTSRGTLHVTSGDSSDQLLKVACPRALDATGPSWRSALRQFYHFHHDSVGLSKGTDSFRLKSHPTRGAMCESLATIVDTKSWP